MARFGSASNAAASAPALDCTIAVHDPAGLVGLQTEQTDPRTNAVIGQSNEPTTIAAGMTASFLLTFRPLVGFPPTRFTLAFTCDNAPPAATIPGVNTFDLGVADQPVADPVALAATLGNDGIVEAPLPADGQGVFAVASINLGADADLVVSADTGAFALPVTVTLCETVPQTGACLAAPC